LAGMSSDCYVPDILLTVKRAFAKDVIRLQLFFVSKVGYGGFYGFEGFGKAFL